ncbi:MAG: DUF1801 domain-containing protein [Silvibacterium sp.]|nr:DUF1801 domain-containing protein [Silvibacterium sp.]
MDKRPAATVDEYLALVPEPARTTLEKLRANIRAAAPEATEVISYGMPAFKYRGRGLVAIAAFKKHCSLFPMSGAVIDRFKDDLEGFHTSKGTLQFPVDRPLSAALLKKIIKARMVEIEARYKG